MSRKLVVEVIGDTSNVERAFRRSSASANHFERDLGKTTRGALAGSGAFKALGRSLAFASGGFLAGASITAFLADSIKQGQEAAVTQKQLAAQFKASGQSLEKYQKQIDDTSLSLSQLSGFEDDALKAAFTLAFRATSSVTDALRLQASAADVARGRHIELTQATIALTRAYGGNVGSLRRLGITIPTTLKGMDALNFVARRFAGQARAGASAQDRFGAALKNTEQTIGLALLPTFNKILNRTSKWLNNAENQKKLQEDVNAVVETGATVFGALADAIDKTSRSYKFLTSLPLGKKGLLDLPGGRRGLLDIFGRGGGGDFGSNRRAGSPNGGDFGTLTVRPADEIRRQIATLKANPRASLAFQINLANLQLLKDEVAGSKAAQRADLVRLKVLTQEKIAKTKDLAERLQLYQTLGSITSQIAAIDSAAAGARETALQKAADARKKELEARKKALEQQRKQLEQQKAQDQKQLGLLRDREAKLRDQIKAIHARFTSQIDTARQGIGDLFSGPVLNTTDDARRRTLGLGQPLSQNAAKLTADLRAQTKQFAAFQRDLNTLVKRGAPSELIRELRAQGLGAAPEAHALATAGKGTLTGFLKAFGKREALAITTARTVMRSQLVNLHADRVRLGDLGKQEIVIHNHLHADGQEIARLTTKHQVKKRKGTAVQRSGRNAGVGE